MPTTEHIEAEWRRLNNRAEDFQPSAEAQKLIDQFAMGYRAADLVPYKITAQAQFWRKSSDFWHDLHAEEERENQRLRAKLRNMEDQRNETMSLLADRRGGAR
jgi:hypothetical protein